MNILRSYLPSALLILTGYAVAAAQAPPDIDEQRSQRYKDAIQNLVRSRGKLQKECEKLQFREEALVREMQLCWNSWIAKQQAYLNSPNCIAIPTIRETANTMSKSGRYLNTVSSGSCYILHQIQDMAYAKNLLAVTAAQDKNNAVMAFSNIRINRIALLEIANQADRIFGNLRRQVDWMGRRSRIEHEGALEIAMEALSSEPGNAGIALIAAASHRSLGAFGDSDDLLNDIDDHFLRLQVIHAMFQAQFDFVNDHSERLKKIVAEIGPFAKENGWVEPLVFRGWIAIVDGQYATAKRWGNEAKEIDPQFLEVGVLIAWAIMEDSPKKSKEAIEVLKDFGTRYAPDDWYYFEALANAWARQNDWNQAKQQLSYALETAPSHMQPSLLEQMDQFKNRRIPTIDWKSRLKAQWKLPR
jgi:tetratricopeptide (TPR) repeat protein